MITITDVAVTLAPPAKSDGPRPLAFCTLTLDHVFVVHSVKVIEREDSSLIVSMPSREADRYCSCGGKCKRADRFCRHCGHELAALPFVEGEKRFYEVCHPVSRDCRALVTREVLAAFDREVRRARDEGGRRAAG